MGPETEEGNSYTEPTVYSREEEKSSKVKNRSCGQKPLDSFGIRFVMHGRERQS